MFVEIMITGRLVGISVQFGIRIYVIVVAIVAVTIIRIMIVGGASVFQLIHHMLMTGLPHAPDETLVGLRPSRLHRRANVTDSVGT